MTRPSVRRSRFAQILQKVFAETESTAIWAGRLKVAASLISHWTTDRTLPRHEILYEMVMVLRSRPEWAPVLQEFLLGLDTTYASDVGAKAARTKLTATGTWYALTSLRAQLLGMLVDLPFELQERVLLQAVGLVTQAHLENAGREEREKSLALRN